MFNQNIVAVAIGIKRGIEIVAVGGEKIKTQIGVFLEGKKFLYTATVHPYTFIEDADEKEIVEGLKIAEICAQHPELFTPAQKDHIIETIKNFMKRAEALLTEISHNIQREKA